MILLTTAYWMKRFYELCRDGEKVTPLVTQLTG